MKIAFTGGGTIGHVAVNLALIPVAEKNGIDCFYIGSKTGIEREMVTSTFPDVTYYGISSGKLRRYFSLENAKDVIKVQKGVFDALRVLRKERPDVLFSKGGFVSVPVIIAAKMLKIPAIIHESDVTPGLANKISLKMATKLYTTFKETLDYVPKGKADYVGSIVREDLFTGEKQKGYDMTGFSEQKKVMLVMGGSLGSKIINDLIINNLDALLEDYQIIHITGKGNLTEIKRAGYMQYEFVKEMLPHLYSITDTIVSRAGSNAIFEFLNLHKPSVLVPLGLEQSRGDQIENARLFENAGIAVVLNEEDATPEMLNEKLKYIETHRDEMIAQMKNVETFYTPETLLEKIITDAK